jgi:hypothetical protein
MRPLSILLLAFIALSTTACGDDPVVDPQPPNTDPLEVTLGTSDRGREFTPITDGDVLEIEAGMQGGYHIWGAIRVADIAPRDVLLEFELRVDDTVVGQVSYVDDVFATDDGAYVLGGITVFIANDIDPESLDGQTLTMRVRVEDAGRRVGEAERTIVASAARF